MDTWIHRLVSSQSSSTHKFHYANRTPLGWQLHFLKITPIKVIPNTESGLVRKGKNWNHTVVAVLSNASLQGRSFDCTLSQAALIKALTLGLSQE